MIEELLRLFGVALDETQRDYALWNPGKATVSEIETTRPLVGSDELTGGDAVAEIERIVGKAADPGHCAVCHGEIKTMCFLGTTYCSTRHQKVVEGEWTLAKLQAVEFGNTREDGIK